MRSPALAAALVLAAAAALWFSSGPEPSAAPAGSPLTAQEELAPQPGPQLPDRPAPPADEGESPKAPVDVEVELRTDGGHEAAARLVFRRFGNQGWRESVSTSTNVMGFAHVELVPGEYAVTRTGSDEGVRPRTVTILPTTREVLLQMRAPRWVSGVVVDEAGEPVEGAEVFFAWGGARSKAIARSDIGGHFSITIDASDDAELVRLFATHEGRRSRSVRVAVASTAAKLRLLRDFGTVRFVPSRAGQTFVQLEVEGATEELFAYKVPTLLPVGRYEARARGGQGGVGEARARFEVLKDQQVDVVLDLQPSKPLRVIVEDAHGTRLRGVEVSLIDEHGCWNSVVSTDSDGVAEHVPFGVCRFDPTYRIEVGGSWHLEAPAQIKLGSEPVRVTVGR